MLYLGQEKINHPGSIVRYPKLKFPNSPVNENGNQILYWKQGVLLLPVRGLCISTLELGFEHISYNESLLVIIDEGNYYDKACERKLDEIRDYFRGLLNAGQPIIL